MRAKSWFFYKKNNFQTILENRNKSSWRSACWQILYVEFSPHGRTQTFAQERRHLRKSAASSWDGPVHQKPCCQFLTYRFRGPYSTKTLTTSVIFRNCPFFRFIVSTTDCHCLLPLLWILTFEPCRLGVHYFFTFLSVCLIHSFSYGCLPFFLLSNLWI